MVSRMRDHQAMDTAIMKEPVDHILRPQLPWRTANDPAVTECGFDASKVKTLTRSEFFQRLKDYGQQRTAMLTCMTCSDTARRWGTWDDDPRRALEREIVWETSWRNDRRGTLLRDELVAVAALIEAHRMEFDAHVTATQERRRWLEQKEAHAQARSKKVTPTNPKGIL
jgi:hypothetical protein